MENNEIIKHQGDQLLKVSNAIAITDKLLSIVNKPDDSIVIQKDASYYFKQGCDKKNKKNFSEAILDFDKTIAIQPRNSLAFEYRGLAKYHLGNFEGAVIDFNRSIEIGANWPYYWVYIMRGLAKINLGKLKEAIADCDMAIKIDPKNPYGYEHRAYVNERLGKFDEAKLDYEKALELDPSSVDVKDNLLRVRTKI